MNKQLPKLTRQYVSTLTRYLGNRQEAVLEEAFELGRQAIAKGLGVLDMARVHEKALEALYQPMLAKREEKHPLSAAETFLMEALSPFEAAHRGFRETNLKLQRLNLVLEKGNLELAKVNQKLELEIRGRKGTESALRESGERLQKMFEEARQMEENLRSLSSRILHAQEEERKRISRELHDEVGQALTAISVMVANFKNSRTADPERFSRRVSEVEEILQKTAKTVHGFARELRPTMLDELGLVPAIRCCLRGFAERTGLRVHFRASDVAESLGGEQKIVLFRIAQESLTNVARHAQANRVAVVIRKVGKGICMEVEDDGKSFQECGRKSTKPGTRLGLLGMQERVRLVKGSFAIDAQPGRGTTIRVVIPLDMARTGMRANGIGEPGGRTDGVRLRVQAVI